MHVSVTAEDITHGQRGNLRSCPIALALNRQTGGLWVVSSNTAWDGLETVYVLPLEAAQFIKQFDAVGAGAPLDFDMDLHPASR